MGPLLYALSHTKKYIVIELELIVELNLHLTVVSLRFGFVRQNLPLNETVGKGKGLTDDFPNQNISRYTILS